MIRVWGRIWCDLGHTDSAKVTRVLATSIPSLLVENRLDISPACLTFLGSLVLPVTHLHLVSPIPLVLILFLLPLPQNSLSPRGRI